MAFGDRKPLGTKRILLLNPPGAELYLRDYYCSKISKANYIYQPVDLLMLSGILHGHYDLTVIDAIIARLNPQECLTRVLAAEPDAIICLTGAVSCEEDLAFLRGIRQRRRAPIAASGDMLLENGADLLRREDCLDAIILDFTSSDILKFLEGADSPLDTITYKSGSEIVPARTARARGEFTIPVPRHELFLSRRYTHPFIRRNPMATVLTDYGCPFRCTFCVMSELGYKYRSVENVLDELGHVARLGIREIYFDDQTFGAQKPRTLELCRRMAVELPRMGWACFSRVDVVDEEFLVAMKRAGCHTIVFGVETGTRGIRDATRKGITPNQIVDAFELCRRHRVATAATFILGLPDEREEDLLATMRLALKLKCDYAAFNVPIPRMRTQLRSEAISAGIVAPSLMRMDQSGTYAVMGTKHLSKTDVERLAAKAIRQFYLRPSYVLSRFATIRSYYDLRRHVVAGLAVLRDVVKRVFRR